MLASAWHLVFGHLKELEIDGLHDNAIHQQLQENQDLRDRYLVLSTFTKELVDLGQARVAALAMTTRPFFTPL